MSGRCAIIERAIRRASEPASLACAGSLCFDPAASTLLRYSNYWYGYARVIRACTSVFTQKRLSNHGCIVLGQHTGPIMMLL